MFFHIANIEREVYWQIGNVCCSAYPIEQLDSIDSSTGELNPQSALNLIVFGVSICLCLEYIETHVTHFRNV